MVRAFDWTGFYIGGHVGYGSGNVGYHDAALPNWSFGNDIDGAFAGGQVGFNAQWGAWVLGVEGEYAWSGIKGTGIDVGVFAGDTYNPKITSLGTVASRLGYAFDRLLVYGKGGWAFAHSDYEYVPLSFGISTPTNGSASRSGYVIGGGLEYALDHNWSMKVEYNYMDFGSRRVNLEPLVNGFTADIDQHLHTIKFGVNYRFGGPVVARY